MPDTEDLKMWKAMKVLDDFIGGALIQKEDATTTDALRIATIRHVTLLAVKQAMLKAGLE